MANTRAQLSALFTPIYDEFMLMAFDEETQVMPRVFDVVDDNTKDYKTDGLSGLGTWELANELAAGGYQDLILGYPKTYTPLKYWKKLQVPFEASEQIEYANLKAQIGKAKMMGIGGRDRVERLAAAEIYDGFATKTSPDGQFLWSTAHPKNRVETGITYDNLLTGPFSHDNLELAEKQIADNFFDMRGIPVSVQENPIILHAPAIKGLVERTLGDRAQYRPGDLGTRTQMEINRFAGRYNPISWRYLSAGMGGSDTAWYIIYKGNGFLKFVYNARPSFDNWIDKDIEAYVFKGRMMGAAGNSDHRCGFASTGL